MRWMMWMTLAAVAVAAAGAPAEPPARPADNSGPRTARKLQALPGRAVGLLLPSDRASLAAEGRRGPADALCFSTGGTSYRWVYVPVSSRPLIGGLRLPIGPKGETIEAFYDLSLANPDTVKRWGVTAPCTLVEVEVNKGQGGPADECFVATGIKVVEGTAAYPLKAAAVMAAMRKKYDTYLTEKEPTIEQLLTAARNEFVPGRKPAGRRETTLRTYATWLPETQRMLVRFETRIEQRFLPPKAGESADGEPAPTPSRPGRERLIGARLAVAYELSREGNLEQTTATPPQSYREELASKPARPVVTTEKRAKPVTKK